MDGTLQNANQIPYGETRHYIQRVMYYYNKYHKLYGDEWSGGSPDLSMQRSIGQAALAGALSDTSCVFLKTCYYLN